MASVLGWGIVPGNFLFQGAWKLLSTEENELVCGVLELFYTLPHEKQTQKDLDFALEQYCISRNVTLEHEQREDVLSVLRAHALHAGPLTPLLNCLDLEEIAITGIGREQRVRVYHVNQGWVETPLYFSDENVLITLLNRLILASGKRLSAHTPIVNAQLVNGSRLHASIFPVCPSRVEASIRKYVVRAVRPHDLLATKIISPEALAYVVLALQSDCNLLIVGNTGSGKTTTLNALLGSLPTSERMILVEETPELHISHEHVVRLTPSGNENTTMSVLIRETLRMRPDRVVVGEIRYPEEARAFMESVLAGQGKGTYGTFHGHSSHEALSRMRQFGLIESDLGWVNVILVQRRWSERSTNGKMIDRRAVCEIAELVHEKNNDSWSLRPIFEWDANAHKLVFKNESMIAREKFEWCFPRETWTNAQQELLERWKNTPTKISSSRKKGFP